MVQNVGARDRLFRTLFGIFGMLLGFLFIQGAVGIIIGVLSLVCLVTGLVGWCGIYSLFGWSTLTARERAVQTAIQKEDEA